MSSLESPTPGSSQAPESGAGYWRSLDELAGSEEFRSFVEKEFPNFSSSLIPESTRRSFLRLMGASMALAGLSSCRWPREEILPLNQRPEDLVPGTPWYFATAMELGGYGRPLVATSQDGRPIKLEGNALHPASRGATDTYSQAATLELFDPDRSTGPARRGADGALADATWEEFSAAVAKPQAASGGAGLVFLHEATSSPAFAAAAARARLSLPQARFVEFDPIARDNELAGTAMVFGAPHRARFDLMAAAVVVDFDSDLLVGHPDGVRHSRDFIDRRREYDLATGINGDVGNLAGANRMWCFESQVSNTGATADDRLGLSPADVTRALLALMVTIEDAKAANPAAIAFEFKMPAGLAELARAHGKVDKKTQGYLDIILNDIRKNYGHMAVAIGPGQPPIAHAIGAWLNRALDSVGEGKGVSYVRATPRPAPHAALAELVGDLNAGKVNTLVMLGGNPVFSAPGELEFAAALAKVPTSVHLSQWRDETSQAATWHLPQAHWLEAWSDVVATTGHYAVAQPLIAPLHGGLSALEVLSLFADAQPRTGYDLVRESAQAVLGTQGVTTSAFEGAWRELLNQGVGPLVAPSVAPDMAAALDWARIDAGALATWCAPVDGLDLVFQVDRRLYDGRFANNGWLQELPDAISKVAWDNALLIAPATAEAHHIKSQDRVRVSAAGGRELIASAYILPGQPANTVGLALGGGRRFGRVGEGVGFDAYALQSAASPWVARGVKLARAGGTYKLASTQNHHAIRGLVPDGIGDSGYNERLPDIFREDFVGRYMTKRILPIGRGGEGTGPAIQDPAAPDLSEANLSLWPEPLGELEPTYRWAMSIDLSACNGCGACVVACNAENNVPIVGKDEVGRGREMHWLRVDRYFSGQPDDPAVGFQPVPCQQCENAPCEQVCPVGATTHSEEGLNDMVYNRCIGTRYCSNNCPYKVRRFNYFNNHIGETELQQMVWNPQVTVRGRGVMEKCTYCTQRISRAKIVAKNAGARVTDGTITPACGQACPTGAIVFGDLNDPASRVARLHRHPRSYAMLEELNVKPRTRYLIRLRNTYFDKKVAETTVHHPSGH